MNRWIIPSAAKIALRLLPVWLPCAICGIVISNGNTYFVEQATHLSIPRPITVATFLFYVELNTLFAKFWHKMTSKLLKRLVTAMVKGRVTASARMFISSIMINSVLCCIIAAKIETQRLSAVTGHHLLDKPDANIPMSVFWLLFQFSLLTAVDATLEVLFPKTTDLCISFHRKHRWQESKSSSLISAQNETSQ